MTLLLATRSPHKAREIRRILADDVPDLKLVDLEDVGIPYDPSEEEIEAFESFRENAAAKARHFRRLSGLATVADDSGLAVDALNGAPGVHSKRFAPDRGLKGEARDRANNRHLLDHLEGVAPEERTARYVCVAVLDRGEGDPVSFRGEAPGRILDEPRGDQGFGYDPLFFDDELGRTFAQISREEKNARSHRGKAFRALGEYLKESHP